MVYIFWLNSISNINKQKCLYRSDTVAFLSSIKLLHIIVSITFVFTRFNVESSPGPKFMVSLYLVHSTVTKRPPPPTLLVHASVLKNLAKEGLYPPLPLIIPENIYLVAKYIYLC